MSNAHDIVMDLFIDDGSPSRCHRKNLLEPSFLVLGAAIGPHSVHSSCCVIDFSTIVSPLDDGHSFDVTSVTAITNDILVEINALRECPGSYIPHLESWLDMFVDDFVYKTVDEVYYRTSEGKKGKLCHLST